MSTSFGEARRRIAEERIRLERDVAAGRIAPETRQEIDHGLVFVATLLTEARIEIEAAGPGLDQDGAFREHFVRACSRIAGQMVGARTRRSDTGTLRESTRRLRAAAATLRYDLWLRLERAA